MPVFTAVAVFFLIWWVVLFAVLPFGVRGQHEARRDHARHRTRRADSTQCRSQADLDHAGFGRDLRRLLRRLCEPAGDDRRACQTFRHALTGGMCGCGQGGGRNLGASRRRPQKDKKIAGPKPCHENPHPILDPRRSPSGCVPKVFSDLKVGQLEVMLSAWRRR